MICDQSKINSYKCKRKNINLSHAVAGWCLVMVSILSFSTLVFPSLFTNRLCLGLSLWNIWQEIHCIDFSVKKKTTFSFPGKKSESQWDACLMLLTRTDWEAMFSLSQPYTNMLQMVEDIDTRWKQKNEK